MQQGVARICSGTLASICPRLSDKYVMDDNNSLEMGSGDKAKVCQFSIHHMLLPCNLVHVRGAYMFLNVHVVELIYHLRQRNYCQNLMRLSYIRFGYLI